MFNFRVATRLQPPPERSKLKFTIPETRAAPHRIHRANAKKQNKFAGGAGQEVAETHREELGQSWLITNLTAT